MRILKCDVLWVQHLPRGLLVLHSRGSPPFGMGEAQSLLSGTRWRPGIKTAERGGQGPSGLGLAGSSSTHRDPGGSVTLTAVGRRPEGLVAEDFAQGSHTLSSGCREPVVSEAGSRSGRGAEGRRAGASCPGLPCMAQVAREGA